ncbi:MAG: glycosyltransferase [Candidatus Kaiserbacteria bacterium]|nr:glycosyltransferase [Candidatus Kaiserbacteria bacterium]
MRLLIVTQVVDTEDPILGFFVRWVEEFAKHVERIEVICLKEGKHILPANVRVHSLGKERGATSRAAYAWRFLKLIWKLRQQYDTVFVHMNPEYIVLGGLFWRLWGKHCALWYTHKSVNIKLRLATLLTHTIFTASKESFRLRTKKLHIMGHGIDVDFFSPDENTLRGTAVLSAGRLSQTKRHDLAIRAAEHFPNDVRIVGDGPERENLGMLADQLSLSSRVHFIGPQTQEGLREEYRRAGVFVHTSETGSLDKVVLEALACGLSVVTTSVALRELPVTVVAPTPKSIAEGVLTVHHTDAKSLATYVQEHHSLQRLIPAILGAI